MSDPTGTAAADLVRPDASAAAPAAPGPPAPPQNPSSQTPPVSSYDAIPYSVSAFPQTRPGHLASVATLFGMRPAHPSSCRVLELGCAAGGNLIPMASADPHAQFVGIDLSSRQIADANATARELDLPNIDLRCLSILDIPDDFGQFDYILCHGVYSWVPPQVQDKILEVCSKNLAPQGVAYVSYNCYPGWHARGAIREMLWYHTERFTDPADRIREARGLLAFLALSTRQDAGFGSMIRQELAILQATPDTYLLHEHLEEFNEPLYFHQFASRAADKGLQYLGEAHLGAMVASRLGPQIEKMLRTISPDLLHMEQYMDFLRNRMFRQTLLCHSGVKLDYALRGESITNFWITSSAKPVPPAPPVPAAPTPAAADASPKRPDSEEFRGSGKTLSTTDPLMKAAMHCLAEVDPLPMRFDELLAAARARLRRNPNGASPEESRQLATRLLNCYLSNLVDFSLSPPAFTNQVIDRPLASPYARLRAKEGGKIVNLRLETVTLADPSRLVLQNLDGQHDRAALIDLVTQWIKTNSAAEPKDLPLPADDPTASPAPAPAPPPVAKTNDRPEDRAAAYINVLLPALARAALLIRR